MALPNPLRRRSKLAAATLAARRVLLARAAFAIVQTKLSRKLPGRRRPVVTPARAALVGGLAAGLAGFVRSRRSSGGDGGGGSAVPTPPPPPPAPANYDAPGPPANTATPLATPDVALVNGSGIDESAEVAAAAAEAGAIGGPAADYAPSQLDEDLAEAERPLAEAGGGVSEGQEQAEADLVDLATTDVGPGTGTTDAERLIEETIEQQSDPSSGERVDPEAV